MRVPRPILSVALSVAAHATALLPLFAFAKLNVPVELDDDREVEVYAAGDAEESVGPLVDDAVLTITVLTDVTDAAVTTVPAKIAPAPPEVAPEPTAATVDEAAPATPDGPTAAAGAEAAAPTAPTEAAPDVGVGTPAPAPQRSSRASRTPPCPANPAIVRSGTWAWAVEREIVEYYATHLKELGRLARVTAHERPDGTPDGFRLGLPRCSILRLAGFRTGDVVKDVNGRRIHNVLQAVGAYFTLRKETHFVLHVQRKDRVYKMVYDVDRGATRRAGVVPEPR